MELLFKFRAGRITKNNTEWDQEDKEFAFLPLQQPDGLDKILSPFEGSGDKNEISWE